ncbi:MAG: LptE family protein [Ignavibacteriae bacterium]|jgi:hypothetical protein|nr:hypothetical protein [Ignavibacteriota bacterium]NOG99845.1 LptE family protein [Ignavibacteriota bacterium]
MKSIRYKFYLSILLFAVILSACNYSFTGSSVPPHLSTVAIPSVIDRSGSGENDLSEKFTNTLIEKFTSDNSLQIADKANADAIVECTILPLQDAPVVVASGENIAQRRITITVKVSYKDLVERKQVFDKNFTDYGDYNTDAQNFGGDLIAARSAAIDDAVDKLTEDILLGVVSNW